MTVKQLTHKQLISFKPCSVVASTDGEVRVVLEHGGMESFTLVHKNDSSGLFAACRAESIPFELQHAADFHRGIAAPKSFGEAMHQATQLEVFAAAVERLHNLPVRMSDAELLNRMKIANGELPDPKAHGSLNDGQFGH